MHHINFYQPVVDHLTDRRFSVIWNASRPIYEYLWQQRIIALKRQFESFNSKRNISFSWGNSTASCPHKLFYLLPNLVHISPSCYLRSLQASSGFVRFIKEPGSQTLLSLASGFYRSFHFLFPIFSLISRRLILFVLLKQGYCFDCKWR